MANKKSLALTKEQYENLIGAMRKGGNTFRANDRIATALVLEANLGLRIGDILKLRLQDIVLDGGRYRLDITEEKTQKNNLSERNKRLTILEKKWSEIVQTIRESLPSSAEMESLLSCLGAPTKPAQIGISPQLVEDAILLTKEVRNRFTLLQILWDTGLSESYAKTIANLH